MHIAPTKEYSHCAFLGIVITFNLINRFRKFVQKIPIAKLDLCKKTQGTFHSLIITHLKEYFVQVISLLHTLALDYYL